MSRRDMFPDVASLPQEPHQLRRERADDYVARLFGEPVVGVDQKTPVERCGGRTGLVERVEPPDLLTAHAALCFERVAFHRPLFQRI